MSEYEQQNNIRLRQIRKRQWKLHAQQKTKFDLIFNNNSKPNFLQKQYYSLIVYGIPTEFRNYLWAQLIPNHFNITPWFYMKLVQRLYHFQNIFAIKKSLQINLSQNGKSSLQKINQKIQKNDNKDSKSNLLNPQNKQNNQNNIQNWLKIIQQDIPRTFPQVKFYRRDSQEYIKLFNILGCFALFNQNIGYVQGLSTIAALLLQQLNTQYRAFTALTTLIQNANIYRFYILDQAVIQNFTKQIQFKIRQKDKQLYKFLLNFDLDIKNLVLEWMLTLFTRSFQLDSVLNIWDILLLNNFSSRILQQLCTAIIITRRPLILGCEQAFHIVKLLKGTKLSSHEQELILTYMRTLSQPLEN